MHFSGDSVEHGAPNNVFSIIQSLFVCVRSSGITSCFAELIFARCLGACPPETSLCVVGHALVPSRLEQELTFLPAVAAWRCRGLP